MSWTERRSFDDRAARLPDLPPAARAMKRQGMMIGLLCENLLAGRDGFAGMSQFIEETESGK